MINKQLSIRVGVGAVVVSDEGKVFLAKRGKGVSEHAGMWETPGGGVEFGETLVQAIARELMEEHGVKIEVGEMLYVAEYIDKRSGTHSVSPAFVCKITNGTPQIMEPDKCEDCGWFTWTEAQQLLLSPYAIQDLAGFRRRYPNGIVD